MASKKKDYEVFFCRSRDAMLGNEKPLVRKESQSVGTNYEIVLRKVGKGTTGWVLSSQYPVTETLK
mgnify:CR=1 FL=1